MPTKPRVHKFGQVPYTEVEVTSLKQGDQIAYWSGLFGTVAVTKEGEVTTYWVVHPSLKEARCRLPSVGRVEKFLEPPLNGGKPEPRYEAVTQGELDNFDVGVHFEGKPVSHKREWPKGGRPYFCFQDSEMREVTVPANALLVRKVKDSAETKSKKGGLLGIFSRRR